VGRSPAAAIVERDRYLGIGAMTALLEKTVDLAHRQAIELEAAQRTAEIASEASSRLLATMSRELRPPRNAIGFAELPLMRDVERMEATGAAAASPTSAIRTRTSWR
jgi:hypothetical protein